MGVATDLKNGVITVVRIIFIEEINISTTNLEFQWE
jgi:hypothetical protein